VDVAKDSLRFPQLQIPTQPQLPAEIFPSISKVYEARVFGMIPKAFEIGGCSVGDLVRIDVCDGSGDIVIVPLATIDRENVGDGVNVAVGVGVLVILGNMV
jgi:hypothetical protein